MHHDIILFDLDGTLTDSGPGIMKAGQYALRAFGIERDWRELSFFVGPPLSETFARFVSAENVDAAVAKFREYYQQDGWLDNAPYPGIPELLERLRQAGVQTAVFSNKADALAREVVADYFGADTFAAVRGQRTGVAPKPAPEGTRALMASLGADPASTLYVGDSNVDVQTAHNAGLPCCGVLWGFRTREELTEAGAEHLAADADELYRVILEG